MKLFTLTVLLCILHQKIDSANILAICLMPNYSHFNTIHKLVTALVDRNHQVTFINSRLDNTSTINYTNIFVEDVIEFISGTFLIFFLQRSQIVIPEINKNLADLASAGPIRNAIHEFYLGLELTEIALKSQPIQKLLNSKESFDAVVLELFYNEAVIGFANHFNASAILVSPLGSSFRSNYLFANPAPASYVPHKLSRFTKSMNFWQRLENFLLTKIIELLREIIFTPKQAQLLKKYINPEYNLEVVLNNISLLLSNSHVSVHSAVPHVPSTVNIGSYLINNSGKLPQDLQTYLDASTDGVILFSLGSNLESKSLAPKERDAILNAFTKIKQNVIWKFEADLSNIPKNVKILKWLPQQDLLGIIHFFG
jgi:hypothetical protein